MKARRSALANILADHTGMGGVETYSAKLGPSPAIEWPISLALNGPAIIQAINIRVVEGIVFSPTDPELPAAGVGWASLTGMPHNCIYVTNPLEKGNPLTFAEIVPDLAGDGLGRISSPPVPGDHLVLRLGEWMDIDEIDERSIASGRIRVQVRFNTLDNWGDLPAA